MMNIAASGSNHASTVPAGSLAFGAPFVPVSHHHHHHHQTAAAGAVPFPTTGSDSSFSMSSTCPTSPRITTMARAGLPPGHGGQNAPLSLSASMPLGSSAPSGAGTSRTALPTEADVPLPSQRQLLAALDLIDKSATIAHDQLEAYALGPNGLGTDNSQQLPSWVTAFHSSVLVPERLSTYAHTVAHHSGYGATGLRLAIGLMARYVKRSGRPVTLLTMHRLFAASMQVAMKANCDRYVKNKYLCRIAGMHPSELFMLESELLRVLDYRAVLSESEGVALPRALVHAAASLATPTSPLDVHHPLPPTPARCPLTLVADIIDNGVPDGCLPPAPVPVPRKTVAGAGDSGHSSSGSAATSGDRRQLGFASSWSSIERAATSGPSSSPWVAGVA